MKLTLTGITKREGDVRSFVFRPETPLTWQAGQYMHYMLPHDNPDDRGIERWFTIAAPPSEGLIVITTRIMAEGGSSFKRALVALQPGDTIEADGPEGDFVVTDTARQHLFIAGGIGITPFYAMMSEADKRGEQLRVCLLYANRTDEIVYRSEFASFQSRNPNFQIQYVVQPARVDQTLLQQTLTGLDHPAIYVSGPEPMVAAMDEQLVALGVDKAAIHNDDFPGYKAD